MSLNFGFILFQEISMKYEYLDINEWLFCQQNW
jgi:hypothetical protein